MKIGIVIPVHNEERFLGRTLDSLAAQSLLPTAVIVVDDGSTDRTSSILADYSSRFAWMRVVSLSRKQNPTPGTAVVHAVQAGLPHLPEELDIICKYDGDLEFPTNYLQQIAKAFQNDSTVGIVGGVCTIERNGDWVVESITGPDHVRGALKAYSTACFNAIGGLQASMGWDTLDEMLARFHGYEVRVLPQLQVKHLKPTASTYTESYARRQGEVFYNLGYSTMLVRVAALKIALVHKKLGYYRQVMNGYCSLYKTKSPKLVTPVQAKFVNTHRWKGIRSKLGL